MLVDIEWEMMDALHPRPDRERRQTREQKEKNLLKDGESNIGEMKKREVEKLLESKLVDK